MDANPYAEAKRQVSLLAKQCKMLSPREAWRLAGLHADGETLWSVAMRVGLEFDASPEDINRYLEASFPRYTMSEGRAHGWDDHHSIELHPPHG